MTSFFGLAEQQIHMKDQIETNISNVLSHGQYILGPEVYELEERLSEYTGASFCITCANGTDALQIALMALNLQKGDEVLVPGFTYIASAEAVALLGAKPVYVDVNETNYCINVDKIAEKITCRTKAIIAVSMFGRPIDFSKINTIAKKHGIIVIEDAAQSFGSTYDGKKSCNLTDIACTSFFPTKPLGCYGDGGAIFTSDTELAKSARQIARHGQSKKYIHDRIGINSRLDTLQAAILLAKLDSLDWEMLQKQKISEYYSSELAKQPELSLPVIPNNIESAWAIYTLRSNQRERYVQSLQSHGIPCSIYYPLPLYEQKALFDKNVRLPVTEMLTKNVFSIPLHAYLKTVELEKIVDSLLSCKL